MSNFLDCKIANDVAYGLWKYNDKQVYVKLTPDEPYFNGKHVCAILGYANTRRALQEHVEDKGKEPLPEMSHFAVLNYHDCLPAQHEQGKAVYITESGIHDLDFKSELPVRAVEPSE